MDWRMLGFPVHHQFLELTQTHIHQVSDAIQPSHPLLSPFPPAPNPSHHQSLFQWVNSSHEVAKVLEFQLYHHSSFFLFQLAYNLTWHVSLLQLTLILFYQIHTWLVIYSNTSFYIYQCLWFFILLYLFHRVASNFLLNPGLFIICSCWSSSCLWVLLCPSSYILKLLLL